MATGMHMGERSIDCLVLGHHDLDRRFSANTVTMRAMTQCKNLSGYRELLIVTAKIDIQICSNKHETGLVDHSTNKRKCKATFSSASEGPKFMDNF